MDVTLIEGWLAHRAYRSPCATERYYCQFGLNPDYVETLTRSGLAISGIDQDGEVRIVELPATSSSWGRCLCRRPPAHPARRTP